MSDEQINFDTELTLGQCKRISDKVNEGTFFLGWRWGLFIGFFIGHVTTLLFHWFC